MKLNYKIIGVGVALIIATIIFICSFSFHSVSGGEMGIRETWSKGVVAEVLAPKNYLLGPTEKIFNYDMTLLKYELPEYVIRSVDNQDIKILSKVQWHRNPVKLVSHHLNFKKNVEIVAINPAMISAILRHGTEYKAIDAYSGDGLVKMQNDISKDLINDANLKEDGVIIESFIIEYVHLSDAYLEQINGRQLATLRQSRAIEEQKAADADALVAKAKAQADLNTQVVAGNRDAQLVIIKANAANSNAVIAAEGAKQQQILQAEASKQSQELEAAGKRAAMIATADGILAQGKAEAESKRLLFDAYGNKGADSWVRIQVAGEMATAFSGIKGFIPEHINMTVLADSFNKAVDTATGNVIVTAPK